MPTPNMRNGLLHRLGGRQGGWVIGGSVAFLMTLVAGLVIVRTVDSLALVAAVRELAARPLLTAGGVAAFGSAFLIRALVWKRILPGLTLSHAWAAIHAALLGNHLLPFRLGEPLRVVSVVKRARLPAPEVASSTVTLRAADLLTVVALAWFTGAGNLAFLSSPLAGGVVALVSVAGFLGLVWILKLRAGGRIRRPGMIELAGTLVAWISESGLVWIVGRSAGLDLSLGDAVLVTSVSVAAQVIAVAPGGFGTYEAAAVAAYAFLGHDPGVALAAALTTHAVKTAYSIATGFPALFYPAPGILGRFRVPSRLSGYPARPEVLPTGPIVLFMPAFNEEESVGSVAGRVPAELAGHPVVTMVIDDGSSDSTAQQARDAGAVVVSLPVNRGLGAAVRTGLIRALALDPVAVVFCDADGEYAPEELGRLVEPILEGRADYVVGSRFKGHIKHMLPHRRLGNVVLTRLLAFVTRTRISDGQSGYRAFSPAAAAAAEIIHDFNYAQVITLDLISKGYRYHEVPISYHFRTTGTSFVKLGRYLRKVVPAVHRQLNSPVLVRDRSEGSSPL